MPWITPDRKVIGDGDTYISADGTQYPGTWDKSGINELTHVERPAEPSDPTLAVVGWHVDDDNKWVWETVPVPQPTAEEILARAAVGLRGEAQFALDKSDVTVLRCVEAGVALPPDWVAYRQTLRAIAAGTSAGPLPDRPDYPEGT